MTMTPERLAELDAVISNSLDAMRETASFLMTHNFDMHPDCPDADLDALAEPLELGLRDLRAHIDEQDATIAEWRKALNMIARGTTFRSKGGAIIDVPLRDKDARNAVIAALKATGDA